MLRGSGWLRCGEMCSPAEGRLSSLQLPMPRTLYAAMPMPTKHGESSDAVRRGRGTRALRASSTIAGRFEAWSVSNATRTSERTPLTVAGLQGLCCSCSCRSCGLVQFQAFRQLCQVATKSSCQAAHILLLLSLSLLLSVLLVLLVLLLVLLLLLLLLLLLFCKQAAALELFGNPSIGTSGSGGFGSPPSRLTWCPGQGRSE